MGMTKGCKVCIGCGVASAVIVAVMVPVGIFVIMPNVAQHYLDESEMTIPNTTMLPCNDAQVEVINHAVLKSSAPFGVTVNKWNATLLTYVCGNGSQPAEPAYTCDDPHEAELGSYMAPSFKMNAGTTGIYQDVSMHLEDVGMLLNCIVVPLLLEHHKIVLVVKSDDISVSTFMGLKVNGLKLHKSLTCSFLAQSTALPKESFCGPHGVPSAPLGVVMDCVYGAQRNLTAAGPGDANELIL